LDASKSNRVIKKAKRIFTIEEKQALCQDWKQSSLSMREFSKLRKVAPSALYQWCRDLYPKKSYQDTSWVPVKGLQNQEISTGESGSVSIELSLPNQSIVRIKVSKTEAISFLQEIYHAASIIR